MSDKIGQFVVIGANVNRTFLGSVAGGIEHIAFLLRNYTSSTKKTKKFFIVQIVKEVSVEDAWILRDPDTSEMHLVTAPKPEPFDATGGCLCHGGKGKSSPSPARDYGRDDMPGCRYPRLNHHCSPSCGGVPHDACRAFRTANGHQIPGWTWKRGNRYYFVSEYSLRVALINREKPYVYNQTVRFT